MTLYEKIYRLFFHKTSDYFLSKVAEWYKEHWKLLATIVIVIAAVVVVVFFPAAAPVLLFA